MKHRASLLLLVALLASVTVLWAATPRSDAPDTEVRAIIDEALERSTWAAEQTYEARYRHQMTQRTRKFAGDGEVTEDEKRRYLVAPVGGVPYARLISKNGGPIKGDDLNTERARWHAFLEELGKDPDEKDEAEEEDNSIGFNEELIGRYTVELEGIRSCVGVRATSSRSSPARAVFRCAGTSTTRSTSRAARSGSTRPRMRSRGSASS